MEKKNDPGYYIDENNNRWYIPCHTLEEAEKLSRSLVNCHNCTECNNCVNCDNCALCNNCKNCRNCEDCKDSENIINGRYYKKSWLQRVKLEKEELYIKIEKLTKFLGSDEKIDSTQKELLFEQLNVMWKYHHILSERIKEEELEVNFFNTTNRLDKKLKLKEDK